MFAFSQIIASGDKVSTVTAELEKDQTKTNKSDDEDSAILAFSNTLPGNDDEPKVEVTDQNKIAEEAKAQAELAALNGNDATSAFGDLVQAEQIQQKVQAEEDSKSTEKDEDGRSAAQIEEDFKNAMTGEKSAPKKEVKKAAPPAKKAVAKPQTGNKA